MRRRSLQGEKTPDVENSEAAAAIFVFYPLAPIYGENIILSMTVEKTVI
jgi:hypothetical protein